MKKGDPLGISLTGKLTFAILDTCAVRSPICIRFAADGTEPIAWDQPHGSWRSCAISRH